MKKRDMPMMSLKMQCIDYHSILNLKSEITWMNKPADINILITLIKWKDKFVKDVSSIPGIDLKSLA